LAKTASKLGGVPLTIKEICALFDVSGKYVRCTEIPTGNVNSTFSVEFIDEGCKYQYVLQKINKNAFKEPHKVMENIVLVTEHIRKKIKGGKEAEEKGVLQAIVSKVDGKPYIIDDYDEYWRCYRFIKNSTTYDSCDSLEMVKEVGRAFGKFQRYLQDFDAESLHTTIPDFHDTIKRYQAFHDAIKLDPRGRVKKVRDIVNELIELQDKACVLQKQLDEGKIPYRVTHNDTKCNNVCFDKDTRKVLAVLDLDTVMPGAIAHDFGDAIRFIANTVIEDDPHIEEVALDLEKYRAFTEGFMFQVKDVLTDAEKESMVFGVIAMTIELSVRFLTDYILGDVYFKIRYPGHNIDRATNQLALAKDMLSKSQAMQNIILEYV
jgi:hypothetical protein